MPPNETNERMRGEKKGIFDRFLFDSKGNDTFSLGCNDRKDEVIKFNRENNSKINKK